MASYQANKQIDRYIASLPAWQAAICQQVRDIVHQADPEVTETIKRNILPYFVLDGNICALMGTRDHVNIFIYDPIAPDPQHIINQGNKNLTARSIQIYRSDALNEVALLELFKAVIANNRAGGWRKVKTAQA